ncbi:MAG: hypothetical protein VKO44_01470 [Cyanobacteriota bacterium]|nr:hypothetical protein [Cyanobacteriota bacterium]
MAMVLLLAPLAALALPPARPGFPNLRLPPAGALTTPSPTSAPLPAQIQPPTADRTKRFPLRREGGGTRAACASRLLAHLAPESGQLAPGSPSIIGLIEGPALRAAPLVLRLPEGDWRIAPRSTAAVRLFVLAEPSAGGIWESFPACDGAQQPVAPPARSLLLPATGGAGDRASQEGLMRLWERCGSTLSTATVLNSWSYGHLIDRLPAQLDVVCERLAPAPSSARKDP